MIVTPLDSAVEPRPLSTVHHELQRLGAAQRRMLPQVAPRLPGYVLQLAYRPVCFVTGDYHDFFPQPDGSLALFVGDASGHGPAAGLLVATLRALFHSHPALHAEPGPTLVAVNRLLNSLIPSDLFMTGVYLVLEPSGRMTWASAGHDPPLRVSARGHPWANGHGPDLSAVGLPLGLGVETYPTVTEWLAPGDRFLLFTDGLVEARGRTMDPFGRHRVRDHLLGTLHRPLGAVVEGLVAGATAHMAGGTFEDDFTVVGVERQ